MNFKARLAVGTTVLAANSLFQACAPPRMRSPLPQDPITGGVLLPKPRGISRGDNFQNSRSFAAVDLPALPKIDWEQLQPEILQHFQSLIKIDSRSGNEFKVVEYLRRVLEAEGIPTEILARDPARPNLVARLKGNGSKRPILIFAHTDVVDVETDKWPVDPFGAVIKDGYVWGRGAFDDKPILAAFLQVMLLLKRHDVPLDRDVIFLAESAEEGSDPFGVGINYLIKDEIYPKIDAEFSLTESPTGATMDANGKVFRNDIGTTEKVTARAQVTATGTSTHGSLPVMDNAVVRLAQAVAKIGTYRAPLQLNPTTREFFEKLANISQDPKQAAAYRGVLDPRTATEARDYLQAHEPTKYALLQNTAVPTIIRAGLMVNVVPGEAKAQVDIRLLPGQTAEAFYAELTKVIDDPNVKIEPLPGNTRPPAPVSGTDSEMYHALEAVSHEMYPGVTVVPSMSSGGGDKAQLRAKGQLSYGIAPATTLEDQTRHASHSTVERLPVNSMYSFTEYAWRVVTRVARSTKPALPGK